VHSGVQSLAGSSYREVAVSPRKVPNRLLEAAMKQASVTNKGLAARVRLEAARSGVDISPDHTSVNAGSTVANRRRRRSGASRPPSVPNSVD
jgi:hypothetical protein